MYQAHCFVPGADVATNIIFVFPVFFFSLVYACQLLKFFKISFPGIFKMEEITLIKTKIS